MQGCRCQKNLEGLEGEWHFSYHLTGQRDWICVYTHVCVRAGFQASSEDLAVQELTGGRYGQSARHGWDQAE